MKITFWHFVVWFLVVVAWTIGTVVVTNALQDNLPEGSVLRPR